MKNSNCAVILLLAVATVFLGLSSPAFALTPFSATQKEVLLGDATAIFVGTVIGAGDVRKGDTFYYGRLDIRVDESVGGEKSRLRVGQTFSIEIGVMDAAFDEKTRGIRITPELAEFYYGGIRFAFPSNGTADGRLYNATVGKQFFFVLNAHPDADRHQLLAEIWPPWTGEWIRSCWIDDTCADSPAWHGPMIFETSACAARVLAHEAKLSRVRAGYAPYVQFMFVGTDKVRRRGLAYIEWNGSGRILMGAPMLLLAETPVLRTAAIVDAAGTEVVNRDQNENPLKAAIPALAQKCGIIYAGDGSLH